MEWTKKNRAEYVEVRLNEVGYPIKRRAAQIADDCKTSHSQATNWLSGAVPRDSEETKRVADKLNLDIMMWVYGRTTSAVDIRKLRRGIMFTKTLEQKFPNEEPMTPEQFCEIVMMDYDNKIAGSAVMETLAKVADIRGKRYEQQG